MSKLKIYACSGLGNVEQAAVHFTYWMDNTATYSNTRCVNDIFSLINELVSEVENLNMPDEEVLYKINMIDLYCCCLYAAQTYAQDNDTLSRAGRVIGRLVEDGAFDYVSLNDEERDRNLDSEIATIDARMQSSEDYDTENDFVAWWDKMIVPNNFVGFTPEQIAKSEQFSLKRVSGSDDNKYGDASKYLNDAGEYFLYTYMTDAEAAQMNKVIQRKRKKQFEVYDYCLKVFYPQYGTEESMKRIIRSGIIKQFKMTPERVVSEIVNKTRGVGELIAAIITLITTLITVICTIITACLEYAKEVQVAKYAVPENVEDATPGDEEYTELEKKLKDRNSNSSLLWIGGIVLAVLLLFKKKKN